MERAVTPLRVLLALLFGILVLAQVVIAVFALPAVPGTTADGPPELAAFRWTVLGVGVLGLLCAEVVVVCTWKLLALVRDGRIFSAGALPWVDAILWAVAAGWALLLAATVPVLAYADVDDAPGLGGMHLVLLLVGAVLGLLVLVLRALLRQATTLRTDLEAVI